MGEKLGPSLPEKDQPTTDKNQDIDLQIAEIDFKLAKLDEEWEAAKAAGSDALKADNLDYVDALLTKKRMLERQKLGGSLNLDHQTAEPHKNKWYRRKK